MATYCEVALTVPLRTTFTYELPESLVGVVEPGSRVAVPFRNKVMVGVVLQLSDKPPDFAHEKSALVKIKKVSHALDAVPALPRTLVELGRWIGSYYLATPGDVFRAMLPPLTELRAERVLRITPAGIDRLAELKATQNRSEDEITEHALLELIEIENAPLAAKRLKKLPGARMPPRDCCGAAIFKPRKFTSPAKRGRRKLLRGIMRTQTKRRSHPRNRYTAKAPCRENIAQRGSRGTARASRARRRIRAVTAEIASGTRHRFARGDRAHVARRQAHVMGRSRYRRRRLIFSTPATPLPPMS